MRKGVGELTASQADRVAGVVVFGSPVFNNDERSVDAGTYDPVRSGLFGKRALWGKDIQIPVISACREYDIYCQGRKNIVVDGKARDVRDLGPILQKTGANPAFPWTYLDADKYHKLYNDEKYTTRAGCELVRRLGYSVDCKGFKAQTQISRGAFISSVGLDVVFLIDTTLNDGSLEELQVRAEEIVHEASHDAAGTRYAVIDYGQGSADVATGGFVTSAAATVSAIRGLDTSGGQYGSLYSAINLANDLDWRDDARKVTLTLSTTRACGQQFCNTEAQTGAPVSYLAPGTDARRAGVYTRNNDWFFDAAGWGQAMDTDKWAARAGAGQPASVYVDELERVFGEALRFDGDDHVSGTDDTTTGETAMFAATDVLPFYSDSPQQRLTWSIQRTGDAPGREGGGGWPPGGGGGPAASALSARPLASVEDDDGSDGTGDPGNDGDNQLGDGSTGGNSGEDPGDDDDPGDGDPLPEDQGPYFETTFTQSGMYTVTLTAYHDGGVDTYHQYVTVNDVPTQAPAAPKVTSTINDGLQTFTWDPPAGEQATAYGFADATGAVDEYFVPEQVTNRFGNTQYQASVELSDPDRPFSLVAYNEVGGTPAIGIVNASDASFTHARLAAGQPVGGQLTFTGDTTPDFLAAVGGTMNGVSSFDLADATDPSIVPSTEEAVLLDPAHLSGTLDRDGSNWTAVVNLRSATTPAGDSVSDLMDNGLAENVLAGGAVQLTVNGKTIQLALTPVTTTHQINKWIVDSDSPQPNGPEAAPIQIDRIEDTLSLTSDDSTTLGAASAASAGGEWSSVQIDDVHTWIGDAEYRNALEGGSVTATSNPSTPSSLKFDFGGTIAGGTPALVRQFLETGAVSFRINGSNPTVLKLRMSESDAADAYPDQGAPRLTGDPTISGVQYGDWLNWQPTVRLGTSQSVSVYVSGDLPSGVAWNSSDAALQGTPLDAGTYPFTLTAVGESGTASKDFTLTVDPPQATPMVLAGDTYRYGSTFSVTGGGWLRADNPAYTASLPILQGLSDTYYDNAANVQIKSPDGTVLPLSGSFWVQVVISDQYGDYIQLATDDLHRTDGQEGDVGDLLAGGGTATFQTADGTTNTIGFS